MYKRQRALSGIKRTVGDIVRQSPFDVGRDSDNVAKRPGPQASAKKPKKKKKKKKMVLVKPGRKRNDIFV